MSHIADLEALEPGTLAVGWLEPEFPYTQGAIAPEFAARLGEFARRWFDSIEALNGGVAMGYHTCGFCQRAHGSGTFGVPAGDILYWCPELVGHYVERHGYAPPAEFVAAVMACPLPGTPEYVAAVAPIVARQAERVASANPARARSLERRSRRVAQGC
jgi:hypothetical protein